MNVRIINRWREDGGRWTVGLTDDKKMRYIARLLRELQEAEPTADWRGETRGDESDWHEFDEREWLKGE